MFRATVHLGTMPVEVEGDTPQDLLKRVEYIRELDQAREGQEATPFHRTWEGFDFYGFRRGDGAEVLFGYHKKGDDAERLFAYSPTSKNYSGYKIYDRERQRSIPAPPIEPPSMAERPLTPAREAAPEPEGPTVPVVPQAAIERLVAASLHLKHGVRAELGMLTVRDLGLWIRDNQDKQLRDPDVYREAVRAMVHVTTGPGRRGLRSDAPAFIPLPPEDPAAFVDPEREVADLNREYRQKIEKLFPDWGDNDRRVFQQRITGKRGTRDWDAADFRKAMSALENIEAERQRDRPPY
jgi:hypothetical protein